MTTKEQSEQIQAKLREIVALMGACTPEEAKNLPEIFAAMNVIIPDPNNPEYGLQGTFTVGTGGLASMAALCAYVTYTVLTFVKNSHPEDEKKQAEMMAEFDAYGQAALERYTTKIGVAAESMAISVKKKTPKKKGPEKEQKGGGIVHPDADTKYT